MRKLLPGFFLILFSCAKDNGPNLPFPWVQKENTLKYYFVRGKDTTWNALQLNITYNQIDSNLWFTWKYNFPGFTSGSLYDYRVGRDFPVFRRADGLYTSAPENCAADSKGKRFFFLRAPASPQPTQFFPDYVCLNKAVSFFQVKEVNKAVLLKVDTFQTYTLRDSVTKRKEYWDPQKGVVKIEVQKKDTLFGTYNLQATNFIDY